MGKIKDTKTRYQLTIEKTFKAELEELAAEKGLSLNSIITIALKEYHKKESRKK